MGTLMVERCASGVLSCVDSYQESEPDAHFQRDRRHFF